MAIGDKLEEARELIRHELVCAPNDVESLCHLMRMAELERITRMGQ